jgi:hypothetical protein
MTTHKNPSEYERLKQELRRLKRTGAPWYFESELHQRLHGGQSRRTRLRPLSPAPAFLVSLIALGSLSVAAYVLFVNTDLFSRGNQGMETAPSAVSPAAHLPPADSTALRITLPSSAPPRRLAVSGSGLSDSMHPVTESAAPASRLPVLPSSTAPASGMDSGLSHSPLPAPDTGEVQKRRAVTIPGRDSLPVHRDTAAAAPPGTPQR